MTNNNWYKDEMRKLFIGISREDELIVLSKFEDIKFNKHTWLYPIMEKYVNQRIRELKTK